MYLNKVYLYGNLTRDPEMKSLPSGAKVTSFSLATNRVYKDKDGNRKENTEYHNIVVFGRQAETSAQYLKKGQGVMIEGRIQTRSWDDKTSGEKKYRTEIIADAVQFGPKGGSGGEGAGSFQKDSSTPAPTSSVPDLDTIDYGDANINVDDIPF
ncbi:MAG: single-strand binding protein single-strand DNA-binding protein [Candidatus Nomurabacteria bacterium]|nr:single-strand binding protein single-strand DNA-binding protein [Candidatus Nomurabacteria bacterium]